MKLLKRYLANLVILVLIGNLVAFFIEPGFYLCSLYRFHAEYAPD